VEAQQVSERAAGDDGDLGGAGPSADPGVAGDAPSDLPPLPPHLRDRPDRPIGEREFLQGRSRARLILVLLFVALPIVVLVIVVLNSLASGPPERDAAANTGLNEVTRYCTYKVRNDGQFDDCVRRTDFRVVRREDSNAARYGRAELTRCLADAGPRCTLR
jgi:hypothetical protein